MIENPSMIRRPIIENGSQLIVGMDEEKIQELTEA
jgi:arsenate reductase-like glutaredoxin family protein